jgi:DNA-binding NarL/FixJ family response regulator
LLRFGVTSPFNNAKMINVIIVEDNQDLRAAIQVLLNGSYGFKCLGAFPNAEDAISKTPHLLPDVALVDINLPGKSGIELIALMKPLLPQVQFVIFTVFEDTDSIFNALKAGATGYLLKSSPPHKILDAITEVHQGGSPMSGSIARKVISTLCPSPKADRVDCPKLSPRENEILSLLAKGLRYKEIGETLHISTETVRTHIRNIYQKLQVDSSIEAINKVYGRHTSL